jgi:hypothetical protein
VFDPLHLGINETATFSLELKMNAISFFSRTQNDAFTKLDYHWIIHDFASLQKIKNPSMEVQSLEYPEPAAIPLRRLVFHSTANP